MMRFFMMVACVLALSGCNVRNNSSASDAASTEKLAAIQGSGLVLVDFFTTWCGPCKAMKPTVEAVEKEFAGKLRVVTVDCDIFTSVAERFEVEGYPTFVILKDGKVLEKKLGGMEAARFRSWVGGYVEAAR